MQNTFWYTLELKKKFEAKLLIVKEGLKKKVKANYNNPASVITSKIPTFNGQASWLMYRSLKKQQQQWTARMLKKGRSSPAVAEHIETGSKELLIDVLERQFEDLHMKLTYSTMFNRRVQKRNESFQVDKNEIKWMVNLDLDRSRRSSSLTRKGCFYRWAAG